MESKVVIVPNVSGRKTLVTIEGTDRYCVGCGKQNVYHIPEHDDFHQGTCYLCVNCESEFYVGEYEKVKDTMFPREMLGVLERVKANEFEDEVTFIQWYNSTKHDEWKDHYNSSFAGEIMESWKDDYVEWCKENHQDPRWDNDNKD